MELEGLTPLNFRFEKFSFSCARRGGPAVRLQAQKRLKCKVSSKKDPPLVLVLFDVAADSEEDGFHFAAEAAVELRAEALPESGEPRTKYLREKCLPLADQLLCDQIRKLFEDMGLPPLDLSDSSFDTGPQ